MSAWLVKTEPETYSIQNLQRDGVTRWDLVRNYQARNFLRGMKKGDLVFIYHSKNPEGVGVVGAASVAREAYPDPSQFDASSEYFDPKATPENPRWVSPDLKFRKLFPRTVLLTEIAGMKEFKGHQLVARGNRLSVLPLSDQQAKALERAVGKK